MANFSFTDTPTHNAIVEQYVSAHDTFVFDAKDWNDTVQVSGQGDVSGKLGLGNDYFSAEHSCGNATVDGGVGADTIIGGKGDDHFHGGAGQDVLIGGAGNDFLDGGNDRDILTGGSGSDTFHLQRFSGAIYSPSNGLNVDVITDFNHHDKALQFDGWGAGLHWNSDHANFLDGANNVVAHLTGLEGVDLVQTSVSGLHQEWFFA